MKRAKRCSVALLLFLLTVSSPSGAAFELRPTRLDGSVIPTQAPLVTSALRDEGWSIGWMHLAPHEATDVSLDALGVSWSHRARWSAQIARLGTPHYTEWMTQLSCRPHEQVAIAIDHLRSAADANLEETGIRTRSTTTVTAALDRSFGEFARAQLFAMDLLRTGDAQLLGVAPTIGGRVSLNVGRFVLGHARSWEVSERRSPREAFELSWRGHPSFEIGQSWIDRGASVGNWLRLHFDHVGVCVWRTRLESGASTSGVAVAFTRSTNASPPEASRASTETARRRELAATPSADTAQRRDLRAARSPDTAQQHEFAATHAPDTAQRYEFAATQTSDTAQRRLLPATHTPVSVWETDPTSGDSWSSAWADSLWSVQDSLEERAREELESGFDLLAPYPRSENARGHESRTRAPSWERESDSDLHLPIPLSELEGDAVARLLGMERAQADSIALHLRRASTLRELSLEASGPVRDLAPYLTSRSRSPAPDGRNSIGSIPLDGRSVISSSRAQRTWRLETQRTITSLSRATRMAARLRARNVEVEARARRPDAGDGWSSLRVEGTAWTVMGGDGFGLPAPGDLWHPNARARRDTDGQAAWVEMRLGSLHALGSGRKDDGSLSLGFHRPTWSVALARLPRDLGLSQLLLRGSSERSEWSLSAVQPSEGMVRLGAALGDAFSWERIDLRGRARWEEGFGRPEQPASRLSAPTSLRSRRELSAALDSKRASADLSLEWRSRASDLAPGAAADETRRWRLGARTRSWGGRAELRLARSHTDARRRSESPFDFGTRTRDVRGTARLIVMRDRSPKSVVPGVEAGIEQRATNTGSWSGRWSGAWLQGTHRLASWGFGLVEAMPAPGRTLSVAPRWVGGRRISVPVRSLLFGFRVRKSTRLLRCDFKAVGPLSPLGPPRFELVVGLLAEPRPPTR